MYFYMPLCNIPFLTSLKPIYFKFCVDVSSRLGWTPTKFVEIGVLPLFKMELLVILCIFWPICRFEKKKIKQII